MSLQQVGLCSPCVFVCVCVCVCVCVTHCVLGLKSFFAAFETIFILTPRQAFIKIFTHRDSEKIPNSLHLDLKVIKIPLICCIFPYIYVHMYVHIYISIYVCMYYTHTYFMSHLKVFKHHDTSPLTLQFDSPKKKDILIYSHNVIIIPKKKNP